MYVNLTDNDIVDPDELLEVVDEVLIQDCKDIAFAIQREYGQYLALNPAGVYTRSSLYPVIRADMRIYSALSRKPVRTEEILDTKEGIVDSAGKVLISARQIASKAVSLTGYYPVAAMNILHSTIADSLARACMIQLPRTIAYARAVYNGNATDEIMEMVELLAQSTLRDNLRVAEEWISKDLWRIYTTSVDKCTVRIEKRMDYRIYDWHRREYDKRHPELWE